VRAWWEAITQPWSGSRSGTTVSPLRSSPIAPVSLLLPSRGPPTPTGCSRGLHASSGGSSLQRPWWMLGRRGGYTFAGTRCGLRKLRPGRAHLTRSSAGQHSPRAVPKTHPSLETVERWEKDRRAGIPATTIAAAAWRQRRPDPAGHPAARAVPSRSPVPRRGARCARSRPDRRNLPTNCPQMERHRLHATCRDRHRHRTPALVQVHAHHLA